jgi:hypothetical protein
LRGQQGDRPHGEERTPIKKPLRRRAVPRTLAELQDQLDGFAAYYNEVRPHRSIGRRTPAEAYAARPKATPSGIQIPVHFRARPGASGRGPRGGPSRLACAR